MELTDPAFVELEIDPTVKAVPEAALKAACPVPRRFTDVKPKPAVPLVTLLPFVR